MPDKEIESIDFHPGDPVRAADLQALRDGHLHFQSTIRGGKRVNVRRSFGGQTQISLVGTSRGKVCVTNGTMTARSGNTPGLGTVDLKTLDATTGDYMDAGVSVPEVKNFSSTTGGIPSGTWGWVSWDDDGVPTFTSADCGN
jgi:hypothetical protein